jgi:hypothetical protein
VGRPKSGISAPKNVRVPLIERFAGIIPTSPQFTSNETTSAVAKPVPISDEQDDRESAAALQKFREKETAKKTNAANREAAMAKARANLKKKK